MRQKIFMLTLLIGFFGTILMGTDDIFAAENSEIPSCRADELKLQFFTAPPDSDDDPDCGATGHSCLMITITNIADKTCYLFGYPHVVLLQKGHILPFIYEQGGGFSITRKPPMRVNVPAHGNAYISLGTYRCDDGSKGNADTLEIILPGDKPLIWRPDTAYGLTDYCGPGDAGSYIQVSPFEPTIGATVWF